MNKEQILAKIKELMAKQQALVDKAKAEDNRALTEDEVKDFNAWQKEIDNLKDQLEIVEKMQANANFMDQPVSKPVIPVDMSVQEPKLDDGGFKNVGEFLHAVKFGDLKGRLKALSTSDVGIMIPEQFSRNIMRLDGEAEIVMPRATNIPAGNPPDAPFTIPYLQQGADGVLGGIELTWTGEAKTVSNVNDPVIKDLTLTPHEVSGMATINNKTLQNWEASGSFVENLLRQAWINGRDMKFLRGSGAGCPLGLLNAPGAIKVSRDTAATIKYVDAATMLGRLLPEALNGAVWVASITALPTIVQMVDGNNRLIFVQGDATRGVPSTLLGIPILWTGKQPTLGNEGDLVLANFRYYLTKAGSGPFVAVSEHVKFTTNQTVFKIVANIDGQPWVKDPLKLEDGETTVSPYIILQ
ncbi:phage major capsid protein [Thermanaerosceptrum fracticalcis]|uniref:Phage major capsid protein n=1 Tax=Thermanaerosceptrum fracticalcis TaxID=1712410 RepID=A0A7G6E7Z8_THEFR|nr:phage major capsid protein [Thermanaerosceptrum fracticalcis]QNB48202.1 phage major capsid protein [Thermanaerosceptrum fracticalcis]